MKKIFIVLFLTFILTGCSAEYTIDIDNGYMENLNVYADTTGEVDTLSTYNYSDPAFYDPNYFEDELEVLPQIERYKTSFNNNIYNAYYKFNDSYDKSNIVNSSVETFDVYNAYNSHIYAKDFTKAFATMQTLNRITINIRTNKSVVGNNADIVNGNVYTWIITRDNPNREISFYYINSSLNENTLNPVVDDNSELENNSSNRDNGNNQESQNDSKTDNKTTSSNKQNKVILYILYVLFFGLIFVIIIFRKKFNK